MFGETTKGLTGDDVIRRGQKDCSVSLELTYGEIAYVVTRSRRHGLDVSLEGASMTDGMRLADAQEWLENLLGFDKKVFLASCYFSQENLLMLTGLSDVDKTDMLTNLLGFERYDDLYNKVFEKIKNFSVEIDKHKKVKTDLDYKTANNKSKIDMINRNIQTDRLRLESLKSEIEGYKKQVVSVDLSAKLESLTAQEDSLESQLKKVNDEYRDERDEIQRIQIAKTNLDAELRGQLSESQRLEKRINSLKSLDFGAKCDKCGAMITQENVKMFMDEAVSEHSVAMGKMSDLQFRIDNYITKLTTERSVADKMSEKNLNLDSELHSVRDEIRIVMNRKSEADRNLVLIKSCEKQLEDLDRRIDKQIDERDYLNDEILSFDDKSVECDFQIDKLTKGIEALEFWKKSFSTSGIRALLLDRFCNKFNLIVNDYLSTASAGTMSVSMSPTKVLKSGEERNKMSLDILTNDTVVKYESLSGGEKRRVDVALCLTLNKWISVEYGLECGLLGLLVLDEIFSYVDKGGEESIATLLYNEGMTKAVFVVSHTSDLGSYAERIINIVKENGVTRLVE